MKQHFGFWLVLSKKDRNIIFPIITKLQKDYVGSPPFEPHLSIHPAVWTELEDAIKVVDEAVSGVKKFKVQKVGFGYQNRWSKILYIEIKKSIVLNNLHERIGNGFNQLDQRPYIPHISLMYKNELVEGDRNTIISGLDVPDEYEIAGIEIAHPGSDDIEWRDYTRWKVIYHKDF